MKPLSILTLTLALISGCTGEPDDSMLVPVLLDIQGGQDVPVFLVEAEYDPAGPITVPEVYEDRGLSSSTWIALAHAGIVVCVVREDAVCPERGPYPEHRVVAVGPLTPDGLELEVAHVDAEGYHTERREYFLERPDGYWRILGHERSPGDN